MTTPSFRDVEQLSAYLDGQLSQADSARLEARLASDPGLRAVMQNLRQARDLLHELPSRRAPRNFRLTPGMAGLKPPLPRAYPALRLATGLAAVVLFFTYMLNVVSPLAASRLVAAPAVAPYGYGGGGCEDCGEVTPPATPSAALEVAPAAPLGTPIPSEDSARLLAAPTPTVLPKALTPEAGNVQPAGGQNGSPVPLLWQIGLAALALTCGGLAWALRLASDRNFREQWQKSRK